MSPGPGTYISPQMNLIKPDVGIKTPFKNPFGTAQPRFDYEKEHLAEQVRQLKVT